MHVEDQRREEREAEKDEATRPWGSGEANRKKKVRIHRKGATVKPESPKNQKYTKGATEGIASPELDQPIQRNQRTKRMKRMKDSTNNRELMYTIITRA